MIEAMFQSNEVPHPISDSEGEQNYGNEEDVAY